MGSDSDCEMQPGLDAQQAADGPLCVGPGPAGSSPRAETAVRRTAPGQRSVERSERSMRPRLLVRRGRP
eukprot:3929981-Alexandrium_andersonii.AAC.1